MGLWLTYIPLLNMIQIGSDCMVRTNMPERGQTPDNPAAAEGFILRDILLSMSYSLFGICHIKSKSGLLRGMDITFRRGFSAGSEN